MPTQVTALQTGSQPVNNQARLAAKMGNGVLVTLVATSTTLGYPHVWTSGDNGATWTDGGALPAIPTTGPDLTVIPNGFRLGDVIHTSVQTIGGQEKLCLLFLTPGATYSNRPTNCIIGYAEFWWDGTSTFSSARGGYLSAFADSGTEIDGSAIYDGTNWYVAAWSTNNGRLYLGAGAPGAWKPAITAVNSLLWPRTSTYVGMDLAKAGSTLLLAANDPYRGQVSVLPIAVSGTTLTASTAAIEQAASGTGQPTITLDGSGHEDIVYTTTSNTAVAHRKRTGTNTYGTATTLGTLYVLAPFVSALRDTSGDFWAVWPQSDGYPVYARLHSGAWSAPSVLDTNLSRYPKTFGAAASGISTTFLEPDAPPFSLQYVAVSYGLAPSAPTGLTSGNVVSTTPTLGYNYVNSLISDPQGSRQYQISHDAGTTIDYDSGQVTTNSTSISVPSGAGLVIGTPTYWRVRAWDSQSNGGLGTAGPYSSWVLITPVQGGTVTLSDIYSAGTTSSSVIASPTWQPDVSWSQPSSHTANAAVIQVYATDGVTLLGQSSTQPLSPVLVSGASLRLAAYNGPAIATGTSVKVRVGLTDTTTGLISWSALQSYTVTFTGPSAPTGFTATPDPNAGVVNLAWTNVSGATSAEAQMTQTGSSVWSNVTSGSLVTSKPAHPIVGIAYDYRVRDYDSSGVPGAWATLTGVVLTALAGRYAVALTDTVTGIKVPLGIKDDEASLGFDDNTDVQQPLPLGSPLRKTSFGVAYYRTASMRYKILSLDYDQSGTPIIGTDLVEKLRAMHHSGNTLLYTAPPNTSEYVKMLHFRWEPWSTFHHRVAFSLESAFPPG